MNEEEIENILENYYHEDLHYESGKILGSMYTKPPDIVLKAFFKFYQSNLGNPGLYMGTMKMEREVVKFLNRLASGGENFYGHILSGGTEANITALWIARNMGYRRILTTKDVHFSILKASNLLKIPVEFVPERDYRMDISSLENMVADGDIVVATAGTTPIGYMDPIEKIWEMCKDLDVFLHVDAAFGGFVIPFLRELGYTTKRFGFDVEGVKSVTIDPHKMGLAPYPAGGLIFKENLFKKIEFPAPYLSTGKSETLLGTRQSGSVAASYSAILYFGWDGYKALVRECMENTKYLVKRTEEEGFEVLTIPEMNIVNIKIGNEKKKNELWKMGWSVSFNPDYRSIRIVVMPHVKKNVIDEFLNALKKVLD